MAMKRCDKGHYYDPEQHSSCPSCGIPELGIGKTSSRKKPVPSASAGRSSESEQANATRKQGKIYPERAEEGRTVGVFRKKIGIDPVVGWLVCIAGPDRGRDYRLRAEKNFIGRSKAMHVCIQNDKSVSRENHAAVSFNVKNNTFKLHPGDSRGLAYLNNEDVDIPTPLKAYDVMEIGETRLMFVPFCGEHFQWS